MRLASVLIGILLFVNCNGQKNNSYKSDLNKLIPKELHHNLPDSIGVDNYKLFFRLKPESNITANLVHIYISYELKNIDSLKEKIEGQTKAIYKYKHNCNIVLYKFQDGVINTGVKGREWLYNDWVEGLDRCEEKRIPIPNFVDVGEGEFKYKQGISDDYTLYVTDAKPGKHFDEKYYADEIIMPKGWKRGYSQGYALNEKENKVIYWFVIW